MMMLRNTTNQTANAFIWLLTLGHHDFRATSHSRQAIKLCEGLLILLPQCHCKRAKRLYLGYTQPKATSNL